jgi:RNA ligase (TIGR02306 family)
MVGGYPVVVRKDSVVEGGEVVYFPPEIQLPRYVADQLQVANYLRKSGTVVKAIRLRGQMSHGMAMPITDFPTLAALDNSKLTEGTDLSEFFGARRFVVPPNFRVNTGQETSEHPALHRYTDIDRYEKMVHTFQAGEQVYVTEKVHGANVRIAMIDGALMVGSRKTQRKLPETFGDLALLNEMEWTPFDDNMYWTPLNFAGVRNLLLALKDSYKQVILFGEVFGRGVQGSFDYGRDGLDFVAFDLMLNGQYVTPTAFFSLSHQYEFPTAPLEYCGEFRPEVIGHYVTAQSRLTKKHIREGIVIKPMNERHDSRHGRVVAKWINPEYLVKKSADKVEDNQEN